GIVRRGRLDERAEVRAGRDLDAVVQRPELRAPAEDDAPARDLLTRVRGLLDRPRERLRLAPRPRRDGARGDPREVRPHLPGPDPGSLEQGGSGRGGRNAVEVPGRAVREAELEVVRDRAR